MGAGASARADAVAVADSVASTVADAELEEVDPYGSVMAPRKCARPPIVASYLRLSRRESVALCLSIDASEARALMNLVLPSTKLSVACTELVWACLDFSMPRITFAGP
jgi:hypothetical protein